MQSVDGDVRLSVVLDDKSVTAQATKISSAIKNAFGTKIDTKSIETSFNNISQKVQTVTNNTNKIGDSKFIQLTNKVNETANALELAKKKQQEFENQKTPTEKYSRLQQEIRSAQQEFEQLYRIAEKDTTGQPIGGWENKLNEVKSKISGLIQEQKQLENSGQAYKTNEIKAKQLNIEVEKAANRHEEAKQKLREYGDTSQDVGKSAKSSFNKVTSAINKVSSSAKKVGKSIFNGFKTAFSKIASVAKSALSKVKGHFGSTRKSSKGMFDGINSGVRRGLKMLLKYGLGVRGLFVLFRKLRTAAKEGFKNLGGYSDSFNKTVSDLLSASLKLKNAVAAAFQPLASAILPIITKIVNGISEAFTKLGEFLAALTGQKYYYKAVDTTVKYVEKKTKSTVKKVQKYLSPLDDINLFTEKDTSDTGDTDTGADPSKMFKTEAVSKKMQSLADKLKSLLKSKDWTKIGEWLGNQLNSILSKIDWNKIQQSARDFATRLYTLINGFVKAVDWTLVGKTIAEGINTALIFLVTLIKGLDTTAIGVALGTMLNRIFGDPKMPILIAQLLSYSIIRGLQLLTALIATIDWKQLSNSIITFLTNIDYKQISQWAINFLNAMAQALTEIDFSGIGNAFRQGLSQIDWEGIWNGVTSVVANALQGLADLFGLKDVDTSKLKSELDKVSKPISKLFNSLKGFADKILPTIINKLLPAVISLIGAIAAGLSPIIDALTPIIDSITNAISDIIEKASPYIEKIGEAIGGIIKQLQPYLEPIISALEKAIGQIIPAIASFFEFLEAIRIGDILGSIANAVTPVINAIGAAFSALQGILDFLTGIFTGDWKKAWNGLKNFFSSWLDGILGYLKFFWDAITAPFINTYNFITSSFKKAGIKIENIWNGVVNFFKNVWKGITDAFSNVGGYFKKQFNLAWTGVKVIWDGVTGFFSNIWKGITDAFSNVGKWFKDTFDNAVKGIKKAFKGIGDWFKNLWNGIWGVIKQPLNWIINGINKVIQGLNSLSIDIPKWVPVVGGQHWGVNIPQIPKLATGAVIPPNKEFMAVLGDQKRGNNIETPENLLRKIIREEQGKSNTYTVNAQVGSKTLFSIILDEAKLQQVQTGRSPFELIKGV